MPRCPRATTVLAALLVATFSLLPPRPARAAWDPGGVTADSTEARLPFATCLDGAGGLFSYWTEILDGSATSPVLLHVQHRLVNGELAPGWSATGRVFGAIAHRPFLPAGQLAAVEDGAGGAFVLYREAVLLSGSNLPLVHRLWHVTAEGVADPTWPDSGLALGRTDCGGPACMAPDGAAGVYVGWTDIVSVAVNLGWQPGQPLWTGLYEQRLLRVLPGGSPAAGWFAQGRLVSGVAPESVFAAFRSAPRLVADATGGALFVAEQPSSGIRTTRAWRFGADASPAGGWPDSGVVFCDTLPAAVAGLACDGVGGAYVAWNDTLAPQGAPRVVHLAGDGAFAPGWSFGGRRPARSAALVQILGGIVRDGAGGVFVQCSEGDPGFFRVRACRLGSDGTSAWGWGEDGITIPDSGAQPDVFFAQPLADAGGGVHLVWGLGDGEGLRDARLTANGAAPSGWSLEEPRVVSSGGSGQPHVVACADGSGAAYVSIAREQMAASAYTEFQLGTPEPLVDAAPAATARGLRLTASPNPAGAAMELAFELPTRGEARLEVLDPAGRRVRSWAGSFAAGAQHVTWDGRSDSGMRVAPGLYFVRVSSRHDVALRRVALVR